MSVLQVVNKLGIIFAHESELKQFKTQYFYENTQNPNLVSSNNGKLLFLWPKSCTE